MQQPNDYAKIKAEGGPYDSLIQTAAANHGVSYDLLHKQLFKESSSNPNAKSPTGPRGLGQFTKATGLAYGLERDEDFFNPEKSIAAAARHMRDSAINLMGDQPRADKQGHMTGLWNALRQFVPNDPLSQSLMQRLAEDQGVDRAR